MTVSIRLKHSSVAAKVPLPADLADGELGLNINDTTPAVYLKDSAGDVVQVGGQGTEPDATETVKGVLEVATQAEVTTGTDDTRAVTPLKLATDIAAKVVPANETVSGIAEIATQTEVDAGTDDTRIVTPLKLETVNAARDAANDARYVEVAGDTMTGNLTAPNFVATNDVTATGNITATGDVGGTIIKATDHIEGVYSSQLFTATGAVGGQGVDFDIPTWCSKIEINHLDWRSTGNVLGTNVALWQFLNSNDTQYMTEPAGSRYEVQWGGAFVGNIAYPDNTSAEVYFIADAATVAHGGTITLHLENTLQTNQDRFRCNFTGFGNYVTAVSGTSSYMQQGIMVSASPNDRPAKLRLVTYQDATTNEFIGRVKFFN